MTEPLLVPPRWRERVSRLPADGGPSGAEWAAGLPRLLGEVLADWGLTPIGPALTGRAAVVVPVERHPATLALKVAWPHREADGEHLALRHWSGNAAVRLVAADPARGALLLERLDATRDLRGPDSDTACAVIGGLLARLHIPAPPTVATLSSSVRRSMARLATRDDVPRRMVARVTGLADELLGEPGTDTDAMLLHGDLHVRHVLAAEREPWLAVGPQPLAGHPAFDIGPVLRHRMAELGTGAQLRRGVRRRLSVTCEAAGVDEELGRLWSIVHLGIGALRAAEEGAAGSLSRHIATLKALED